MNDVVDVGEMSFWMTDESASGSGQYEITLATVLPTASLRVEALDVPGPVTLRVKKWDDTVVIVRGHVETLQYEPAPDVQGKTDLYMVINGDYEEEAG